MTFNFEKFLDPLRTIGMTTAEKQAIRMRLVRHMAEPVSTGTFLTFRIAMVGALALVLFVGSGGLITYASQGSLPGEKLYSVKLNAEQVRRVALLSSSAKANYDLGLIEKRFSEVNQLISDKSLNEKSEAIATLAIQTHAKDVKKETDELALSSPAEALSFNTKLTKTLTTGTNILLALSDQSETSTKTGRKPNTLVLATYATARKLSADTAELEMMVIGDTDEATMHTAERKYGVILALLAEQGVTPTVAITALSAAADTSSTIVAEPIAAKSVMKTLLTDDVSVTAPIDTEAVPDTTKPVDKKLQDLADKLQAAYDAKKYGEVVIITDQIEQELHDAAKIKAVEETYNITVPDSEIQTPTPEITTPATPDISTTTQTQSVISVK